MNQMFIQTKRTIVFELLIQREYHLPTWL